MKRNREAEAPILRFLVATVRNGRRAIELTDFPLVLSPASPVQGGTSRIDPNPPGKRVQLSNIYLFEVASQKAQWLSARQTAIASNVANANTPGYRAVDIQPFAAVLDSSPVEMAVTDPAHLSSPQLQAVALREVEVEPSEGTLSGNTVNLEQQMINLGDVNRDYSMSANIRRAFHQFLLSALK
jgi:flagellar basal-body rod protein FlgB